VPFLVALGIALVLTPLARLAAPPLGLVDSPGDLKVHPEAVSVLGGVAVTLAALAGFAVTQGRLSLAVGGPVLLVLAAGVLDDATSLPSWWRLALQAAAGVALVALVGFDRVGPVSAAGIVLIVILCCNAVNMVDGQDGLAGGAAALAALALAAAAGAPAAVLGLALAGALVGFLPWNRPPARVFLGDGGAYAIGTILAMLAVEVVARDGLRGVFVAGIALAIFAWEFVFTVARRLRIRTPLMHGDRLHTYDLVAGRLGRVGSTLVFWAVGAAAGGLALLAARLPAAVGGALAGIGLAGAVALGLVPWARRRVPTEGGG
jgi:UDP-GlcNAc:undecaprenyl-phosphate/decaprenyl-phosphate GlcNAc-1-phosphate transferase